ncbi:cysteine-rich Secretory family protein [Ceratobasidium sp. AG-Ba]|nr:cysteine-rich Secretory family protein [Ceratobasidium sp. AG-Ba]QRW06629.1 cysteine-rich Secretory family protein [Ceratobasidium sp. AG-Ba]
MTRFAVLASIALAAGLASAAPAPAQHEVRDFQVGDFDWINWFWHTRTRTATPVPTLTSIVSLSTAEVTSTSIVAPRPTTIAETSSAIETSSAAPETSSVLPATSTVVPTTSAAPTTTVVPTTTPKPTSTANPSPSKAATTTQAGSGNADIDAYLKGHNDIRALHNASPLTWADDLAAAAAKWAGNCVWQHSQGKVGKFGENLAAGTGLGAAAAVKMWTDEASEYDPANPQYSHFTQVVWKATTEVGCAVTSCTGLLSGFSGAVNYHVCEYRAPGNVIGQFAQNVQV